MRTATVFRTLLLLAAGTAASLLAGQVELQLVVHDQPTVTVDKMERSQVIARPVSTAKGIEMKTLGVDVVCWARNVLLDDKPVFERYHEGKYIDRLPIARANLNPGDHTIWPGNHVFTIAKDNTITSKSPELIVEGSTVKIKCYPFTLRAYRANPEDASMPQSMRDAPLPTLTLRESGNSEAAAKKDSKIKVLELLPVFEKFAPLSIWLPGNTATNGYIVHPLGLAFHLNGEGVKAAPGGKEIPGLQMQKNQVDIPLYGFPVVADAGAKLITINVEQLPGKDRKSVLTTNWFPRGEPYEMLANANAVPLKIDGDPRKWPFKNFRIDIPDPAKPEATRLLAVEFEQRHFQPGGSLAARMQVAEATLLDLTKAARISLRVQAYGSNTWTELKSEIAAEGMVKAVVPDLADGLYQLQAGILPAGSNSELAIERWVSIAKEKSGGVGLFTHRGRTAFQRGEEFWLGLSLTGLKEPLAAGTNLELELTDSRGTKLPLLKQSSAAAINDRETFIVRLDGDQSLKLAAGKYTALARVGTFASRSFALEIVDPEPTTHFTNMLTGKYNPQGDHYSDVLQSGHGADALARSITSMGHNSFQGMSYNVNRVVRTSQEIEQVARERSELGPWESYYQPSGRDKFLNASVRYGLRFYEDVLTYHDTMLPRDPKILEACARFAALETASLRHSPAFKGICLYDEIYAVADTGTPMSAHFLTAEEMTYRARNPGLTSADAMRALERYASRPFGQRKLEDLEKFKTWPAHEDYQWGALSQIMAKSIKKVMPDSQNFTLQRFWGQNGGNLNPNGTSQDVFAPLDVAACVMYKDGGNGDRPVFAPMQADVMRVRENLPVWTQLHTFHAPGLYGQHLLRQAFFAVSQKIDGLTYFSIDASHTEPSLGDNRDPMDDIAKKLCTPYGDFFIALQRGYKKVAVYYSREADYLEAKKPNKINYQCEGLWVACARAGFPADYLFDADIRAGKANEYDVVFAPGFTFEDETAPDILAALKKVVNAGKTVAVERSSKLPIEGLQRLDSEFDEYDDKMGGSFPRYIDFETEMVWDQSEQTTKLVRSFLNKHTAPAAIHDLITGPDWLRSGKGEYMVVPNFAPTGFSFLHKTMYQAPDRPMLKFPKRPPVCYDVLEMKRVDVATKGEWMSLQADFRACPGKIYAFLPAEIGRVELKTVASAKAGADVSYQIQIFDKSGQPLDAGFPLQIEFVDANGTSLQRIYRAAAPTFTGVYRLPLNLAAGNVRLKVRELISGTTAEATLAPSAGDAVVAKLDSADVHVSDGALLKLFLAQKEPVVIALDEEQSWCRAESERLKAELEKRGRTVRIETTGKAVRLPAPWDDKATPIVDGARLWRGDVVEPGLFVDGPLVVIGKRYDNRLIEALVQRDVLAETLSENFPGRGRSLLGCVHQAFSNQFDTVTILSNDEAGLRKGIDALLAMDTKAETHPARAIVKSSKPDASAKLVSATVAGNEPESFSALLGDMDRIHAIDVDSTSGRIIVGTFGYGFNLFCFAADGKLAWKQFLPEHNVYSAQWFDGGKRIVAATGVGNMLFLIDAAEGRVLKKMKTSEWANFHYGEGSTDTQAQIVVNTPLKQIVVRGITGVFAIDYDGKVLWHFDRTEMIASYPEKAEQTVAASFGNSAAVGNIGISPDGKTIAYSETRIVGTTSVQNRLLDLWGHRPMLLDAASGKVTLENSEDGGSSTNAGGWWVHFPADSSEPLYGTGGFMRPLQADGKLGAIRATDKGLKLKDGSQLMRSITHVSRSKDGVEQWRIEDDNFWVTGLDQLSENQTRYYRCGWNGLLRCIDVQTGKIAWEHKLNVGGLIRKIAGSEDILVGGKNGALLRLDASGKILWQTRIREHNTVPDRDYPKYVAAARAREVDSSGELFPIRVDAPGDYENILRQGIEQVENGDFEKDTDWEGESGGVKFAAPGHTFSLPGSDEGRALVLQAGQLITQKLNRRVMPGTTYLLEFMYRADEPTARLTAGGLLKGTRETLTASKFSGRVNEWSFGRVALKSGEDTTGLSIGFEAEGGTVRVDKVSLKAVRFPSANLLANSELHQIEPTFVRDIRVRYSRIPSTLRDKLRNRSHMSVYKQGGTSTALEFSQEVAFLHNGRLDDVGPIWTYEPETLGYSASLVKPSYISHIVIYLNNATPQQVYPTLAVMVNRIETEEAPGEKKPNRVQGIPKLEAMIRGNTRRFVVVHFPKPILTDSIKILPGKFPGRHENFTEVELYGPLGGETGKRVANTNPLESPMYLGNPAHVPTALPADVTGTFQNVFKRNTGPVFNSGVTTFDGLFAFGDPNGAIRSVKMLQSDPLAAPPAPVKGKPQQQQERIEEGLSWPLASITPTTTPAHFSGRMFVGSADEKMHAVADNGTYLWAFKSGGRIYSSPVPEGDDVYFGSDDGKLYKVDVDSGALIWEFATGGRIRGAPALANGRVVVVSADGNLYAVSADTGLLAWKSPLAEFSRSSPAVKDNVIYVGDEAGNVHAIDAATGKSKWKHALGGYVSQCPLITDDGSFFVSEQGEAILVSPSGAVKWKKALGARVSGQALASQTQVLLPTERGLLVLKRADGESDTRFTPPEKTPRVTGVALHMSRIYLMTASATVNFRNPPRTYVDFDGGVLVWAPKAPAVEGSK